VQPKTPIFKRLYYTFMASILASAFSSSVLVVLSSESFLLSVDSKSVCALLKVS
jgi:hypothetical protein